MFTLLPEGSFVVGTPRVFLFEKESRGSLLDQYMERRTLDSVGPVGETKYGSSWGTEVEIRTVEPSPGGVKRGPGSEGRSRGGVGRKCDTRRLILSLRGRTGRSEEH